MIQSIFIYLWIPLLLMIPSYKRLTWKDIAYMLRRGKKYYGDLFVCVVIDQYTNRPRHQVWIQIPVKLDKRATMRNQLKRAAQWVFWEELWGLHSDVGTSKQMSGRYKKRFIFVNKKQMQSLIELLATSWKTTIVKKRKEYCIRDFTTFIQQTWVMMQSKNTSHMHKKPRHK